MNFKKITLAFYIGLISLASLSLSFSIAWYATSTTLRVDTIVVDIRGERELQISKSSDPDSFKEELPYEQLDKSGRFMPVSSMFQEKWISRDNGTPEFYEYRNAFFNDAGAVSAPTRCTRGFYQQTLYLMCDDDAYVSLDVAKDPDIIDHEQRMTYFIPNYDANRSTSQKKEVKDYFKGLTEEEIYTNLNELVNALRLSIYDVSENKYYIFDPNKNETTYLGGVLDNNMDKYFDTYIDGENVRKEGIYGEVDHLDKAVYEDVGNTDEDIKANESYSCFTAIHPAHSKKFLRDESLANGLFIKEEPSITYSDMESAKPELNKFVLNLKRYEPKEIIVSIYLEGWDHDCINTNMGASFLSQIQFKILREA